jgi:hypothetical protein
MQDCMSDNIVSKDLEEKRKVGIRMLLLVTRLIISCDEI